MPSFGPVRRLKNAVARYRELTDRLESVSQHLDLIDRRLDDVRAVTEKAVVLEERAGETLRMVHAAADASVRAAQSASRHTALRRNPVRVLFLVHNAATWGSYGELVELMRAAPDFDPIVMTIPHFFAGVTGGEDETHAFLTDAGVPHLRLRDDDSVATTTILDALDPDIVFRQSQWDQDIAPEFSPEALGSIRLCLIPYETMNIIQNAPWGDPPVNSAVDSPFHRRAWLVFVANERALGIAQEDSILHARQFRALGHPKADALRRTPAEWPFTGEAEGRGRVLWSAHHSILRGWSDFGLFPKTADEMLAWASQAPELEFVFIQHPLLLPTFSRAESPMSLDDFAAWQGRWNALPNTAGLAGAAYPGLLQAADVVVTDGPSMMAEAQVVGTPVVFVERENHVAFNEIGTQLMEGVHRVSTVAEARTVAPELLAAGDPLAPTQRRNARELFGEPGAATRILDAIRDQIHIEVGEPG